MLRLRNWIGKQTRKRMLLLSVPLVLVAAAAAFASYANVLLLHAPCYTAREFADSLRSERTRRTSVDSVIALFDLEDPAVVLKADTEFTHGEPNRLERMVIGLGMEGVTAPQIYRWLTADLRLTPIAQDEHARRVDPAVQAGRLHKYATDSTYIVALVKTMSIARNPWRDPSTLEPLAARWAARCATHERGIWVLPAIFALAMFALLLCWLWWLRPGSAQSFRSAPTGSRPGR